MCEQGRGRTGCRGMGGWRASCPASTLRRLEPLTAADCGRDLGTPDGCGRCGVAGECVGDVSASARERTAGAELGRSGDEGSDAIPTLRRVAGAATVAVGLEGVSLSPSTSAAAAAAGGSSAAACDGEVSPPSPGVSRMGAVVAGTGAGSTVTVSMASAVPAPLAAATQRHGSAHQPRQGQPWKGHTANVRCCCNCREHERPPVTSGVRTAVGRANGKAMQEKLLSEKLEPRCGGGAAYREAHHTQLNIQRCHIQSVTTVHTGGARVIPE